MKKKRSPKSTVLRAKDDKIHPSRIPKFCLLHWRGFLLVFFPIILLPILFVETTEVKAYRCLYILLLMAFYWLTEALPLPVTGMLPILFFPVAGIMSSEEVCASYFSDTLVWFLGGIIVALAVEYCDLHKRIALKAIQIVGCQPRRLHLWIILISMFISLWISNAAVVAMMCPIIKALLNHLEAGSQGVWNVEVGQYEFLPSKLAISFYIGAAYAATIGGSGTLIATATNLAMKGIYDGRFPEAAETIDFVHFILYAIPPLIIITLLMCLYLQYLYMGLFRPNSKDAEEINYSEDIIRAAEKRIDRKYFQMGSMSCHEISVLTIFIQMLVLYLTFNVWNQLFEKKVKYSSPTILIIIILFVLPINYAFCKYLTGKTNVLDDEPTNAIHSWKLLQQKVPWGLIFFIGGGFALAKGIEQSQLAILFRNYFFGLYGIHPILVMFVIIIFAECVTQLCLNVAVVSILIPIIIELCIAIELHPLYLVLPTGVACSMAFILPAATAPNAIVAMFANIKTKDMIIAGIGPTIISIVVLCVFCPTWGPLVYPNINNGLPDWLYK